MSTRSMIAFDNGDVTYAIYCHYDGYIGGCGVGRTLYDYYNDIKKVEELIDLGNLSILRPELGEKQFFDSPKNSDWCLAYGRDRGEEGQEAKEYLSVLDAKMDFKGCDYFYVFDGNEWKVSQYGYRKWKSLNEYFEKEMVA
jgi:hypothetical protein